jgi:hypothetical protein
LSIVDLNAAGHSAINPNAATTSNPGYFFAQTISDKSCLSDRYFYLEVLQYYRLQPKQLVSNGDVLIRLFSQSPTR